MKFYVMLFSLLAFSCANEKIFDEVFVDFESKSQVEVKTERPLIQSEKEKPSTENVRNSDDMELFLLLSSMGR